MARAEHFARIRWKDRRQRWGSDEKPHRLWRGLDTETCRGNVKLIADSEGSYLQEPELGTTLEWLYRPTERSVWFNLRYDIECILKKLPREEMQALLDEGQAHHAGFVMQYIPKKMFALKPGEEWKKRGVKASYHYDIMQFFNSSLDNAAKLYLGDQKQGMTKEEVKAFGRDPERWTPEGYRKMLPYCVHDAKLTARLARLWDDWSKGLELDFTHPISPAYVTGLRAEGRGWPAYTRELHQSVGQAAWLSYAGGRFESRIKGYGQYWSADITSAYPGVMETLPNPAVPWHRLKKLKAALAMGDWGFVLASVKVSEDLEWGPLPYHQRSGPIIYPVGNLGKRWMTLAEYATFQEDPDITLTFHEAYVAKDDGTRPLKWIGRDFKDRQKLKRTCADCGHLAEDDIKPKSPCPACGGKTCDPREYVLKVLMNAIYGKTMQKTPKEYLWRPATLDDDIIKLSQADMVKYDNGVPMVKDVRVWDMGNLFNPIWGSYITAETRLKLWEAIKAFDTAAVATDGILTREPIPASFGSSEKKLGTWEVDKGPRMGVIVGNGLYQMEGEKPKRRGFGEPYAGFEWLKVLREVPPDSDIIVIDDERPLHPGEIMKSKKWTLGDVGNFVAFKRQINLNADEKRSFPKVNAKKLLSEQFIGDPLTMKAVA